ncbi:MAG: Hsp20/alpha crystallin family protein [Rhodoferax sp.]|nr:Hsp20/alpha crystallin family protein [Rhodoferax sp.]
MFFATQSPALVQRTSLQPASRAFERFLVDAMQVNRQRANNVVQDETSYTLVFDVPGVVREQLVITVEDNVVRVQSKEGAPRHYASALELPTDIDVGSSEAKLEHGVLTVKLGKRVPVSKSTELPIS